MQKTYLKDQSFFLLLKLPHKYLIILLSLLFAKTLICLKSSYLRFDFFCFSGYKLEVKGISLIYCLGRDFFY